MAASSPNTDHDLEQGLDEGTRQALTENWVTLGDLARLQRVTYRTALSWIKTGKVKAIKVGGQYRVYESEILRFIREGNREG